MKFSLSCLLAEFVFIGLCFSKCLCQIDEEEETPEDV